MIFHEIAVEPTAIHTLRDIQLVLGYVGFSKGRLIANFPECGPCKDKVDEDWAWRVVQSIKRTQIGKAPKVRELLIDERRKILRIKRRFDHGLEWIENARFEHLKTPFGAIISENPKSCELECSLDDFSDKNCPLCLREDQHVQALPKQPDRFAMALMPMLRCASELRFIDPHYLFKRRADNVIQLSARHAKVVQEIAAKMEGFKRVPRIIEFHVLGVSAQPEDDIKYFVASMEAHLPKSWKAKAFLWHEKPSGKRFHARYLLTDAGGVGSEYGLDEGRTARKGGITEDETDLYLLPEQLRAKRTMDFDVKGNKFTLATDPVEFSGIR
jgi:hypothetical protein